MISVHLLLEGQALIPLNKKIKNIIINVTLVSHLSCNSIRPREVNLF